MSRGVTVDANGQVHKLRLTTRGQEELEELYDKSFAVLASEKLSDGKQLTAKFLRQIVQQAMNDGAGGDKDAARQLLDDLGGPFKCGEMIGELVKNTFPETPEGAAKEPAGNVRKAKPKAA